MKTIRKTGIVRPMFVWVQWAGFISLKARVSQSLNFCKTEAENHDERFGAFADFADELTDQFWAMHYPGGEFDEQSIHFEELRAKVGQIIRFIKSGSSHDPDFLKRAR